MVECLAAGVTVATLSHAASSFFDTDGPPPAVGQLVIVIDPGALGGAENLAQRVGALAEAIEAEEAARVRGSRRLGLRERAARQGTLLAAHLRREGGAIADGGG